MTHEIKAIVGICREDNPHDVDEAYGEGTYARLFPDGGITLCPFCGSKDLMLNLTEWESRSLEPTDANNTCTLQEHQCQECAKSFWSWFTEKICQKRLMISNTIEPSKPPK